MASHSSEPRDASNNFGIVASQAPAPNGTRLPLEQTFDFPDLVGQQPWKRKRTENNLPVW